MTSLLFILNDAPYGNERAYNALRLAAALAGREDQRVRVFLLGDAVGCAKAGQKLPEGSQPAGDLLVTDARRGVAPWFVVTGDTIFVGAVGRPDLAGHEAEMAGALYDSLHTKLLTLADEVEIYPGHQAGSLCGAGLSGKPSSALGFEKRWNPLLSLDRDAFVAAVGQASPKPAGMETMLRFNRGLAA